MDSHLFYGGIHILGFATINIRNSKFILNLGTFYINSYCITSLGPISTKTDQRGPVFQQPIDKNQDSPFVGLFSEKSNLALCNLLDKHGLSSTTPLDSYLKCVNLNTYLDYYLDYLDRIKNQCDSNLERSKQN